MRCEKREMVMVISTKNSSYSPTGPGQAMPDISIEKEGLAEISGFEQSRVETRYFLEVNTNLRNSNIVW